MYYIYHMFYMRPKENPDLSAVVQASQKDNNVLEEKTRET